MKNRSFRRMLAMLLFATSLGFFGDVHAVVTWSNAAGTPDVNGAVDPNLTIDGSGGVITAKGGSTTVTTNGVNIVANVINDPIVQANNASAPIYFCANNVADTITVNVSSSDLIFRESANGMTPLLLVFGGPGQVIFNIDGGRTLSFTSNGEIAGTRAFVFMENQVGGVGGGRVLFQRDNSALNSSVTIGGASILSYISNVVLGNNLSDPVGCIEFNGSNTDTGRLILEIEDTGGLIVAPHLTTAVSKTTVTLANIDQTLSAARTAQFKVTNSNTDSAGSLLVLNHNFECYEFLVDPFCTQEARQDNIDYNGDFDGIRYGFVLGANGQLDVNSNAYLDYVSLALNRCPCIDPEDVSLIDLIGPGLNPKVIHGFSGIDPEKLLKARNFSAFVVDGNLDPNSTPARINFNATSGIYFRSGVDAEGNINNNQNAPFPFILNEPLCLTEGAGNIVFDVEGRLEAVGPNGSAGLNSKFELLSLEVSPTGGTLFIENQTPIIFPNRTFNSQVIDGQDVYSRYNKGAFLVNNAWQMFDTTLQHTDENHVVLQKNDVQSQPTYIGGETFTLKENVARPKIEFVDSRLLVHTNIAFTGVDLLVPNGTNPDDASNVDNTSLFKFYQNGKVIDMGTGRQMILGTTVGSQSCNGCSIISQDAHLDVLQTLCDVIAPDLTQVLSLQVCPNNAKINPNVPDDIANQTAVHTIYLGHATNICIGTQATTAECSNDQTSTAQLKISGNFFSFATRGGTKAMPELSNVTGQGGIFVDRKGKFSIDCDFRASISTMVTRSLGGDICLPKDQVYFDCGVGIAEWQLNLEDPDQVCVILPDQCFSDYTLNWINVQKDYVGGWCPYDFGSVSLCNCNPVEDMNLINIPKVQGEVNQFQIQGSRIGDEVSFLNDGGWIRELVFLKTTYSATAPVAFVALQNGAQLGLGTAQRNPDSSLAQYMLGVNGVTLVALESPSDPGGVDQLQDAGDVLLNEDMLVNNICPFLRGPALGENRQGIRLRIGSTVPRELRVRKGAALDFRQFLGADAANDILSDVIEFYGDIRVILEPGAKVLLNEDNGAQIQFVDGAQLICEPSDKAQEMFEANTDYDGTCTGTPITGDAGQLTNTDPFRVKFVGVGTLRFRGQSRFLIPGGAYAGVETLNETIPSCDDLPETSQIDVCATCVLSTTNLEFLIEDSAQIILGAEDGSDEPIGRRVSEGGTLQIGNTEDRAGHTVAWTLRLLGDAAEFRIKAQGFLGLGVGITDKRFDDHDQWLIDNTYNVALITFDVAQGLFAHDRIFAGDDPRAALMAIGANASGIGPLYSFVLEVRNSRVDERLNRANVSGGGNIILLSEDTLNPGAVCAVVGDTDNDTSQPRSRASILASRVMMGDGVAAVGPTELFNFIKINDWALPGNALSFGVAATTGDSFRASRTPIRVGWRTGASTDPESDGILGRQDVFDIASAQLGQMQDRRQRAVDLGYLSLGIEVNDNVTTQVFFAQIAQ